MPAIPIWRRLIPVFALIVLLGVVIGINVYYRSSAKVGTKAATATCSPGEFCTDLDGTITGTGVANTPFIYALNGSLYTDGLAITASFSTIDTASQKVTVRLNIVGLGQFAIDKSSLTLVAGDTTKKFDLTSISPAIDVTFTCVGDASSFPFDVYDGSFPLAAFVGTFNITRARTVPIGVIFSGQLGTYFAQSGLSNLGPSLGFNNQFFYEFSLEVNRSKTTKFFAIFMAIIMWGLLLGYGLISLDMRFKGRKFEVPFLALGASLLFALPNIRNAAPLAPPIGTQLDMAGLFVALIAIGGCLMVNMFRVVYEIAPPKPPAVEPPKPVGLPPQDVFIGNKRY